MRMFMNLKVELGMTLNQNHIEKLFHTGLNLKVTSWVPHCPSAPPQIKGMCLLLKFPSSENAMRAMFESDALTMLKVITTLSTEKL
jgi:hypothetical protein